MLRLLLYSLLLVTLPLPVLAAPAAQADEPVTLRLAMPTPASLDPVAVSRFDLHTRDLLENLYVGLTRFDPQTHTIEPMLAERWSVSADGFTWTFELRDDIQWVRYDAGQGDFTAVRPVVAGDVAYSIQRACDPLRPSPVTANLMIVRGCQTVAEAFPEIVDDLFIAREIGVRATGPHTLEIDLLFPAAYFPALASTLAFRPVARESVAALTTPGPSVLTNGPYALQAWNTAGLTLQRNPHWPDPLPGNVARVAIQFVGEGDPVTPLVTGQRVDMARLSGDEIETARTTARELLRIAPGDAVTVLGFSFDRAMVQETDVRRALALTLDGEALVQEYFAGSGLPATHFTPENVAAAPAFESQSFEPGTAQMLFNDAGYPGCQNVPEKLLLLVPDEDPRWADAGQAITRGWSNWLGCNPALLEVKPISRVLLIELSHAVYDPDKVTRSHMWVATWHADYPDANAWLGDALHCEYGYFRTRRACDAADAWLDQAAVEADPTQRAQLYTQVEEHFFGVEGTFPVIPLFTSTHAWLQQPWLTDVNAAGAARYDLWMLDTDARGM